MAYLSSFDLGVQTYAVNRLTQAYARGDLEEYRRVQHTAFAFYFRLALLGSVALSAFGWWAPIRFWFHLSLTDQHSVSLIVLLTGTRVFASKAFVAPDHSQPKRVFRVDRRGRGGYLARFQPDRCLLGRDNGIGAFCDYPHTGQFHPAVSGPVRPLVVYELDRFGRAARQAEAALSVPVSGVRNCGRVRGSCRFAVV